ncbi:MAG: flagellar motor protein MotA, partial [Desulfobulbaceae bacterium]
MKTTTRIGFLLGLAIFLIGFIINGNLLLYLNISGILIVLGGVAAASLLSFRLEQLRIVAKVIRSTYK